MKRNKAGLGVERASQVALVVKNPPANARDVREELRSLGWEDALEKGMTPHPSILAWRIPWTEEPGGLQSMGSQSQTGLKQLSPHACMGIESGAGCGARFLLLGGPG